MLNLNDDKIDLIVFGTRKSNGTFGDTIVEAGSKVRILGVIFDQTMSMQQQVNTTAILFEMQRTHPQVSLR